MTNDRVEGTVKFVNTDRGFGFVEVPGRGDVFLHFRDCSDDLDFDASLEQRRVSFSIVSTSRGDRAKEVRPV